MGDASFNKKYKKAAYRRYMKTLEFLDQHHPAPSKILDLGPVNPFTDFLKDRGYDVTNTPVGMDLDYDHEIVMSDEYSAVTAFEILEHMVNPFGVLTRIKAPKLIASVPLNLWYLPAHWNPNDPFDRHYHEFYPKQFDMLMEKSGWKVVDSAKWIVPSSNWGITPLFKRFTPRYYIVYCERS
jgi:hypothetical protein